jgi:CheY-like chemotaxis protein
VADNGQEALDLLHRVKLPVDGQASKPYDVVFCDLEMPVMDGLTAIKTIREEESTGELSPRQLVIALTGNARPAQIESALSAGMDDGEHKGATFCVFFFR